MNASDFLYKKYGIAVTEHNKLPVAIKPMDLLKYMEEYAALRQPPVMRMMAVSFAKWLRDNTVADGAPKLLLRLDMKRYTIEELYDLYTLIAE